MNIEAYIDHTILKPSTTIGEVEQLCKEAIQYQFAAVCVPPFYVKAAKQLVLNTDVKVATVIGFPFGYSSTASKVKEAEEALADGADELDMVHNIAALKNGDWDYLSKEVSKILVPTRLNDKVLKVIIESGILTDTEIIRSCELYAKHHVDFVKTSTGYAEKGASLEAVKLMRAHLPEEIRIKASGGIRTYEDAQKYVAAGASRIGASASVHIAKEQLK
ncbi:deoxyribose-phosphate aldolase [Taibaiella sp. KBW10]|uniref:deoxyribose-phosphate aldolase n=1 Tax=Taibaiella sp. KBW10 TaxID=2153357 RepID=UPI000F597B48|nr:deoxyribose-phosphate aldolase [Taibaiella sp. KBW10]RQO30727.1 deoxyribose-phosphate aldolase [Taibaiella sp. KBW10]